MKDYNGKVLSYKTGVLMKEIHFPNGDVCCENCFYFKSKKGANTGETRSVCTKTFEPINSPVMEIGLDCPLIFEEETEQ